MNAIVSPPATTPDATPDAPPPRIVEVLRRYWGFDTLRPLQLEAINASLSKRDSLVVLPTGGGKSLCYQVPPLIANRTDIVVSPLISLMKDQVDALTASGYPAAALHSGLSPEERNRVMTRMSSGEIRLLLVAPERLLTQSFLNLAERLNVRSFAIDEAHCISQWGHDFRPEYSKLAVLKKRFPDASIHAYTATATPRVREDIIRNLGMTNAKVLVGGFDRPNLTYRIEPLTDQLQQILRIIDRHHNEAVIVYCISRKEVEALTAGLTKAGVKALSYHAGMSAAERTRTQEAFAAEQADVIVATVAFGMGIDRSNVRCVIHAGLPKSIEAYQQETGRAGRDGLEAECVLLYSGSDVRRWEFLIQRSAEEGAAARAEALAELKAQARNEPERLRRLAQQFAAEERRAAEAAAASSELLRQMQEFATGHTCRHAALVRYFGQEYTRDNCGACDICLDTPEEVQDGAGIVRQILGCVRELQSGFGAAYVVDVLSGSRSARIQRLGHDRLASHGSLRMFLKDSLRDFVNQCVGQGLLQRTPGEMPVLQLTPAGRRALDGQIEPKLTTRAQRQASTSTPEYHHGLFEELRTLRKEIAAEMGVAPFVIFSDVTLRELAAVRPSSIEALRGVRGIGEQKAAVFGERFVSLIAAYSRKHGLSLDNGGKAVARTVRLPGALATNASRSTAFRMFENGASVAAVAAATGRTAGTVIGYLEDFISERKPANIDPWVNPQRYRVIEGVARQTGGSLLRPVFDALNGTESYDDIRLVMRHAGLR